MPICKQPEWLTIMKQAVLDTMKFKGTITINSLALCLMLILSSCKTNVPNMKVNYTTVQNLNIEKYMGTWYEIARFDHSFERGLEGVTATYNLLPNGKISVLNAGFKNSLNGKQTSTKAKAKIKGPGWLKVFFIPFFGANYYVLELDKNYQWALVGSSSPKYLWILSRTSHLDHKTYEHIVELAKKRGYDTNKLLTINSKLE